MRNQRHDGPLAQLVEHLTLNQGVQSSILWRITIFFGRMVKRLRHRPFTAVSGVRFPLRSPTYGRLAQLGERLPYKQNVSSSILLAPTTKEDDTCVTLYRLFYFVFFGQEVDTLWNRESCRASGQTLYPLTRVLSPFQGDTAP